MECLFLEYDNGYVGSKSLLTIPQYDYTIWLWMCHIAKSNIIDSSVFLRICKTKMILEVVAISAPVRNIQVEVLRLWRNPAAVGCA